MDPYLEGYLWSDLHQGLAAEIRKQLTPRLQPRYVARLAISVVQDGTPPGEIAIMYPDVEVLPVGRQPRPVLAGVAAAGPAIDEPLTLPRLNVETRLVTVEIRDAAQNQLVTSIEILSPTNKREPGLADYRRKRKHLEQASVHLLEIDLLRRGERPLAPDLPLPDTPYLVTLTRAQRSVVTAWPIRLQDALPTVAVPLRDPDPDIPLELGAALTAVYDEARYDLSLDYTQPPPGSPFAPEEAAWLQAQIEFH
jgi:hypothetical protein